MRRTWHRRLRRASGVAIAVVAAGAAAGSTVVASAAPVTGARPSAAATTAAGPVSTTPAAGTPALLTHTSPYNNIRQLVDCGGKIYAVGKFTQITWNGTTYSRNNAFSFKATAPYTVTAWNPNANAEVESIALSSNCGHSYLGGSFTRVGGGSADHIAELTPSGTLVNGWAHHINKKVDSVVLTHNHHLLVGGVFTSVNGDTKTPYLASLNPSTGKDDGFAGLHISGTYHYCSGSKCSTHEPTQIFNQQLNPGGTQDLAEGVFTSVGGKARQQIFMLNVGGSKATVSAWTSPEFNDHCKFTVPFYIRAAAWSPGGRVVYIASTGERLYNWNGKYPLTGICDATAAYPATQRSVTHTWLNYTGCDSLFAVAADSSAEYVAGHPRWMNNGSGCNFAGPGAIPSFGLQGRNAANGSPLLRGNGNGRYSMSRANGDDMLITRAGLWIASSNRFGMDVCGHKTGHAGICFLPY